MGDSEAPTRRSRTTSPWWIPNPTAVDGSIWQRVSRTSGVWTRRATCKSWMQRSSDCSLSSTMNKARYIMVGGFLGAGKTTAILKLAELLRDDGLRVGLITNDQSFGLVDTAMLGAHGF